MSRHVPNEEYALCILGAGLAGVNALYAATRHLKPTDRVLVVDRLPRSGGMWNETYSFVRLHQPHPFFTAGDIPWTQGKPPEHLATREEILDHFAHCMKVLGQRVTLSTCYGYEYVEHLEHERDGVDITFRAVADGQPLKVRAQRFIKALGLQIERYDPLPLSSRQVVSTTPMDPELFQRVEASADAPIFVVGGGKTGMDTVLALIDRFPEREIRCLVGRGTMFTNRDKFFPVGRARWWTGTMTIEGIMDVARHFNGDNEQEAVAYYKHHYAISMNPDYQDFLLGLLSEAEAERIQHGTRELLMDYLEDVVDRDGIPVLKLRQQGESPTRAGAIFVNCTGFVLRQERPLELCLSRHGRVLSVNPTCSAFIFSSFGAYFLTHLFYLDTLRTLPLYVINGPQLLRANKQVFALAISVQLILNIQLVMRAAPLRVMLECGIDFDRWYPLPRRLIAMARMMAWGEAGRAHCRHVLDRVRERFAVDCAPLPVVQKVTVAMTVST